MAMADPRGDIWRWVQSRHAPPETERSASASPSSIQLNGKTPEPVLTAEELAELSTNMGRYSELLFMRNFTD